MTLGEEYIREAVEKAKRRDGTHNSSRAWYRDVSWSADLYRDEDPVKAELILDRPFRGARKK